MTAEIIISSIILLICIAPVIIIGIVQYRSKDSVGGGWTGKEPPQKEQNLVNSLHFFPFQV